MKCQEVALTGTGSSTSTVTTLAKSRASPPRDLVPRGGRLPLHTLYDTSTTILACGLGGDDARPRNYSLRWAFAYQRCRCAQRRPIPRTKYVSTLCTLDLLLMHLSLHLSSLVGWSSAQAQPANPNFGQPYAQQYDQAAYAGGQDVGVKGRLVNLISAVRTLMRSESQDAPSCRRSTDWDRCCSTANWVESHYHRVRNGMGLADVVYE